MAVKRDEARLWVDRDLGGLELLRATYVEHRSDRHAHEGFAVGVIERRVKAADRPASRWSQGTRAADWREPL